MTMLSMWSPEGRAAMSDINELHRRDVVDTCDLPHPPFRVPFLGDVLGLNPRTPFQSSLPQTKKLGPISARKMLGTEMVAVSGLDLVAEVHDETRFGKYVGHHLTPLREVIGDALITVETDNPNWRLAHDILKPAFSREAMQGYHSIMLQAIRRDAGPLGRRGRHRAPGRRHRGHDAVGPGIHRACRIRLSVRLLRSPPAARRSSRP